MKSTASSLFAKTKTEFARTKQKAMVKMGKADETVDINYNNEKQRFLETYKVIKKTNKNAQKFLDILKDLSIVQASLAEDFYELYDNDASLYNATIRYQETSKALDVARVQIDEKLRADVIEPISKYIGQYKDIKNRMKELETRKVDMDRYQRDVRTTTEKAKAQGQLTMKEQKYETARLNYANLHDELCRDLPLLNRDRIPFFDPVLASYIIYLSEFYRDAARTTLEPTSTVNHVNRAIVHDHPRVTTPPAESYSGLKASSAPPAEQVARVSPPSNPIPGPTSYPPSQSAVPPYANDHVATATGYVQQQQQQRAPVSVPVPVNTGISAAAVRTMPIPPTRNRAPSLPLQVRAQALYDFVPQENNELGFKINDIIIIHKQTGEWWEGELNGKRGLLPSNYVKLM